MANQSGGSVVYDLDVDKSKLTDGLSSAEKDVANSAERMDNSIKQSAVSMVYSFKEAQQASMAFATGLAAIVAGGAAAAGFGIKIAADLETMRAGFVTLLGSAQKADAAIAQIKKDASATPFELPGLIQANQLLTSVTKDADRSEKFLLNIGKALTAMGKGQPELDRIIVNLQQIGAVGHASAIDIKQFAFAGIPIYELLNKALEKTTVSTVDNSKKIGDQSQKLKELQGSLRAAEQRQKEFTASTKESTKISNQNSIDKYRSQISDLGGSLGKLNEQNGKAVQSQTKLEDAIRDGKITFELLEQVFNDAGTAGGQFANAFTEQAGTFNQLFSNLKDNIGIAASEIVVSTGIFGAVKQALGALVKAIGDFTPNITKGIIDAFSFIKDNGAVIVGILLGGLTPAIITVAESFLTMTAALSPFLVLGFLLGGAVKIIIDSLGGWEKAQVKLNTVLKQFNISSLVDSIKAFGSAIQQNLPIIVGAIVGALIPTFGLMATALAGVATAAVASLIALAPYIAIGALIGAAIKVAIDALGGWGEAQKKLTQGFAELKARLDPLVAIVSRAFERIGQIISGFGISGDAGGLKNFFSKMVEDVSFYTGRALQIMGAFFEKVKSFLAFGRGGGEATFVQALEGIATRLQPLKDAVAPIFEQLKTSLALTGQIIQTQVKPAFDALVQALQPLIEKLQPKVIELFKAAFILLGVAIATTVAVILAVVTGLVNGFANALPYIAQALEGVIQVVRGFVQLVTGILTGDWSLAWEGAKQIVAGAVDFFMNGIHAILSFVKGFVEGVYMFFKGLYDALVGHSIVPDMINEIVAWFVALPQMAYDGLIALVNLVLSVFTDTWNAITGELGTWGDRLKQWGENIARSFVDGFSKIGDWLKDKVKAGLDSAKSYLQGQSPPKDGPFREIDKWGENVGMAWVNGLRDAMSTLGTVNSFPEARLPGSPGNVATPKIDNVDGVRAGSDRSVVVNIGQVNDNGDVEAMSQKIAFKAAIA